MEYTILSSALAYPKDIEAFLEKVPLSAMSQNAQKLFNLCLECNAQNIDANVALIETKLGSEFVESEFFKNVCAGDIYPQWLNLIPAFKEHLAIQKQKDIAHKLLNASEKGQVVDIEILSQEKNLEVSEAKSLRQWVEYFADKPILPKIKCGIDFLDVCFDGGFELGQLVLISGDPEAGKTMLSIQMLEYIAKTNKVCFFCFEFTIESYLKRHRVRQLDNMYIFNDGYDINEICQNIKSLYKKGVRVFLIDSQMRITSPSGRNMEEEESLKFSSLAKLCHSLKILIFLIVQTSKGDRDNPMGSKKGGHESSITIRIERSPAPKELKDLQEWDEKSRIVLVKKNKQTGRHFSEKVNFDPSTCTFSNPNFSNNKEQKSISYKEIEAALEQFK